MEAVVVGGCDVTLSETFSDWRKRSYDPALETMTAGVDWEIEGNRRMDVRLSLQEAARLARDWSGDLKVCHRLLGTPSLSNYLRRLL